MNVLGRTRVLGVFGHPVSHSLSPVMHNAAIEALGLDYIYVPFHVQPENLEEAVTGVRALGIAGVNVTIPHKERIIEYLDEVSDYALQIGSVNTVVNENGRLRGDTTDGSGFMKSAEAAWGRLNGSKVLVLGAGGSAKAVSFVLGRADCKLVIANRTYERAAALVEALNSVFGEGFSSVAKLEDEVLAEEIRNADLLVNTTSVGMHPDVDSIPVRADLLRPGLLVYDLVYNPLKTKLVVESESRKASAVSGLKMLAYQGAQSFEMWTGVQAPVDVMEKSAAACFSSQ